jgi:cobalt/nickel transport system permease protein
MALVGALGGYLLYRGLIAVLPKTRPATAAAAGGAGGLSVVLASLAFVLEYVIGGEGGAAVGTVAAAMVGVHALIGIGEGLITALVVGAVLATRPDLVAAAPRVEVLAHG